MDDELVNRVTWKIPNALALVGSRAGDERNAMTTSWITQLSMEPVLVGVGVDNGAVTHRLITAGGSFTVNLWDAENTRPFVKFSKPAQGDETQLNGLAITTAVSRAPVAGPRHAHPVHRRGGRRRRQPRRRAHRLDERHAHEVRRREAALRCGSSSSEPARSAASSVGACTSTLQRTATRSPWWLAGHMPGPSTPTG